MYDLWGCIVCRVPIPHRGRKVARLPRADCIVVVILQAQVSNAEQESSANVLPPGVAKQHRHMVDQSSDALLSHAMVAEQLQSGADLHAAESRPLCAGSTDCQHMAVYLGIKHLWA